MNNILEKAVIGALGGLIATARTDHDAFKRDPKLIKSFDWKLALVRYAYGVLIGAGIGLGIGQVSS